MFAVIECFVVVEHFSGYFIIFVKYFTIFVEYFTIFIEYLYYNAISGKSCNVIIIAGLLTISCQHFTHTENTQAWHHYINVVKLTQHHGYRNQEGQGVMPLRFYNFAITIGFFAKHVNLVKPLWPPDLSAFLYSCKCLY